MRDIYAGRIPQIEAFKLKYFSQNTFKMYISGIAQAFFFSRVNMLACEIEMS
jgi:hypothetical protein